MTNDPNSNGEPEATAQPRLHGDILATSLLAFLKISSAYGYHLAQQLSEAGLPAFDSGTVYRTLRQLEKSGLVSSFWDTSESGPARRMYELTAAGQLFLNSWFSALEAHQAVLRRAFESMQTGGFAAPAPASTPSAPAAKRPRARGKAAGDGNGTS